MSKYYIDGDICWLDVSDDNEPLTYEPGRKYGDWFCVKDKCFVKVLNGWEAYQPLSEILPFDWIEEHYTRPVADWIRKQRKEVTQQIAPNDIFAETQTIRRQKALPPKPITPNTAINIFKKLNPNAEEIIN